MNPRAWIRFGPGEEVRCPLCTKKIGEVPVVSVALVRRASQEPVPGSVIQQCPRGCGEKYELQTLPAAAAA